MRNRNWAKLTASLIFAALPVGAMGPALAADPVPSPEAIFSRRDMETSVLRSKAQDDAAYRMAAVAAAVQRYKITHDPGETSIFPKSPLDTTRLTPPAGSLT